jgi:hypothetical protein
MSRPVSKIAHRPTWNFAPLHLIKSVSTADGKQNPLRDGKVKGEDNRLIDGGEVSLMLRQPFTPRKIPGINFC